MTARDARLPAGTKRDGGDLQRFMGMSQSLDSLTTIVGPAVAALLIGTVGGTSALWFTAALSAAAAIVTMTLPRVIGIPETAASESPDAANPDPAQGIAAAAFGALQEGLRVLLRSDRVLACSTLFSFGIVMVLGSFQGLVLPVHFTLTGQPELLGYVLSALSGGMLASSLAYAALAPRLSKRAWYVTSLVGMAAGVAILGTLPPFPLMLLGALVLGVAAGPASALLGFFMYDRIPDASRGSAFGTQNSIMLVTAPVAVFATSVAVSVLGDKTAALILIACWGLITAMALLANPMRRLDEESAASGEEASPEAAPAVEC